MTTNPPALPLRSWLKDLREAWAEAAVGRSPDRRVLRQTLLPVFQRMERLLWVGCRRYTLGDCRRLERRGAVCWTLDIDPRMARWSRPGRHSVGDLLDVDGLYSESSFDAVLCNGVFGWGVDGAAAQRRALEAIARVLASSGWLLIGWNTDRMPDPRRADLLQPWFRPEAPSGLAQRIEVEGTTHVFDLFRRTEVLP